MELTLSTKELIAEYGITMTINAELTEKASKVKIANANHPKIVESRRIVRKLKIKQN